MKSVISEKEFHVAGTSSGASPAAYYKATLQANSSVLHTSLTPLGGGKNQKKKKFGAYKTAFVCSALPRLTALLMQAEIQLGLTLCVKEHYHRRKSRHMWRSFCFLPTYGLRQLSLLLPETDTYSWQSVLFVFYQKFLLQGIVISKKGKRN